MAPAVNEGLWQRAFQLAYFILLDRRAARDCVARAIEKLAAQQTREKRRRYWRGRKTQLTIRRISRPTEDTLQWLICLEAEVCEKEQESRGGVTEADMVVRYVKHLAQMTTVSSSFHVNVAFNRLLRNYTTPEVQQIFELATGRYPGAEEYRKAKGKLLNQLTARFERFLRVHKGQYGELQLETQTEPLSWSDLVEECLELFAPWSGRGGCLQAAAGGPLTMTRQSGHLGAARNIPDRLETSRCHWFMHSTCYARLVEQLGFDPPRERLSVPRFLHHDGDGEGSDPGIPGRRTSPLSKDEIGILRERLAAVAADRSSIAVVPMRIVAHGALCATLNPARDERCRFEIPEHTRLIEIRSDAPGDDRVLATHWVDRGEDDRILAGEYTLALQGRRELALSVVPTQDTGEPGGTRAVVTIESRDESSILAERLRSVGSVFDRGPITLLRPILVSVALIAVGGLASAWYFGFAKAPDRTLLGHMAAEIASQKATIEALRRAPATASQAVARYPFSIESSNVRGVGSSGEPVVTFAPGQSLVILELPADEGEQGPYRLTMRSFPDQQERLRVTGLRPIRIGNRRIVEFPLPATMVESDTHYLLSMTRLNGSDSGHYLFEARKK